MMMLAQGPTDWVSPLTNLGEQGGPWLLVALAFWAVIKLYNDLGRERTGRLEDSKAFLETVKASTAAMVASTASQEDRNRALENLTQAIAAMQRGKS